MPFQPGQSGNPAGRRAELSEVRDLARQHTEAAIRALVEALSDPKQRVAAATALLDRGYGKPKQEVETSGSMNLNVVTGIDRAPDEIADQSR